ncbi:hypothetical protein ACFW9X_31475, partial [Streptomyces sp. NPDC059466]
MSDTTETRTGTPAGPQPEPLRFFGTTWVEHDGGYPGRRAGVGARPHRAAVGASVGLGVGKPGRA